MLEVAQKHCCKVMNYHVHSKNLIDYEPESRDYLFTLRNHSDGNYQSVIYCPWCGKKLPKSLNKEWCAIIKEKFGLDYVLKEDWDRLPKEFKTEEWWRKRGL
jgi:hypothetical protein